MSSVLTKERTLPKEDEAAEVLKEHLAVALLKETDLHLIYTI